MTFEPDPEKLAALAGAISIADDAIRMMVIDELTAVRLPEFQEREAFAAGQLQEAYTALQGPEKALADLEKDIARTEGETRSWDAQAHSDDISKRVAAKAWFAEWNAELDTLNAKREQMERDITPLRTARDEAKNRLYWARRDVADIEFNTSDTAYAFIGYGPKTEAFQFWYLFGFFVMPLITGHPFLHAEAMENLEFLCRRTGYRTDELSKEDSRKAKAYWDALYEEANQDGPAPSGAEVVSGFHQQQFANWKATAEQSRLDHDVVEDHRQPVPPRLEFDYQRLSSVRT